jgi:hypothetical protein
MRILQIIAALLMLVASPAIAKDVAAAWVVTQKSGDVRVVRNGLQPASVQLRAALSPGDIVATGATGRAMLTKGDDYVVVAPASRLILPKEQQQTGFTRLIQQFGTMLYKVKRTGVPHFSVETPMLAAVVKGTTFTVVVDKNRAAVQVTEGVVEVSSVTGDVRRLVEGGMTVYIGRERPNEIIDVKSSADLPSTMAEDGEAIKIEGSGDVTLATIATLTDGLVREAPVVASPPATNSNSAGNVVSSTIGGLSPAPISTGASAPLTNVIATPPEITDPIVDVSETAPPATVDPIVEVVETTVPAVTDPVIDIVDTVLPEVTDPVVDIVDTVVPDVTEPVVEIVETVAPEFTEPVVEIVETVAPEITEPVVDVAETLPNIICGLLCPR